MSFTESKERAITEVKNMAVEHALQSADVEELRKALAVALARIVELEKPPVVIPPPPPPPPPPSAYPKTVRVTQADVVSKLAALTNEGTDVIVAPGRYVRTDGTGTWQIKASNVRLRCETFGDAILVDEDPTTANQAVKNLISVSGSNVVVEKLAFDSTDGYGSNRPIGISVGGSNVTVRDVDFRRVDIGVNLLESSRDCIVRDITWLNKWGLCAEYVVYIKGKRHLIQNITVEPNANFGCIRMNLAEDTTIRNLRIVGGGITIQKSVRTLVEKCNLTDAWLEIGPLNNKDGVRGDGGPVPFLQSRTIDVVIRDIVFGGTKSKLTVGNRSDGVHIDRVSGPHTYRIPEATTIVYPAGATYPAGSVASPKAVNVWKDGVKVA